MRRYLLACLIALTAPSFCLGQQVVTINLCDSSGSTCPFGAGVTSLIQAADGNFYGTTVSGGANNQGTVFRVSPLGAVEVLHNFCALANCSDGSAPSGIIQGTDGNFYGTTTTGGPTSYGTVFRLALPTNFEVLHEVGTQAGGVIEGTDGRLYGGANYNVFALTTGGTLTQLFGMSNPALGSMVQASDGNYYGTASQIAEEGDPFDPTYYFESSYFEFSSTTESPDNAFCCAGEPVGNLVEAKNGQLYGAAEGIIQGYGDLSASVLYSLQNGAVLTSQDYLYGSPVALSNGNLLTTEYELDGTGSLIEVTPAGVITTLDSNIPYPSSDPVVLGSNGQVYVPGGSVISDITPETAITPGVVLTASKTSLTLGQSATLQWTVNNGFSDSMKRCAGFLNGAPVDLVPLSGSYVFTPTEVGSYAAGITCGGTESASVTINVSNGSMLNTSTVMAVSPNPVLVGRTVLLNAQVTRSSGVGTPGGVISFYTGSTLLGSTAMMDGTATVPIYSPGYLPSNLPIVAKYSGDSIDNASQSAVVSAVIYEATATGLTASPTTVAAGQTVTLTASVDGDYTVTSGTVKFYYGSTVIGQAAVKSGVASFTASTTGIPSGIYPVTATYEGTPNFTASTSSAVNVTVDAE